MPDTGTAARFGGEEFAVLLPGADLRETRALMSRLRERLARIDFRESDGHPELRVTFSGGIAEYPRHGETPMELLAAADSAVYAAKDAGRDRTLTVDDVPPEGRVEVTRWPLGPGPALSGA